MKFTKELEFLIKTVKGASKLVNDFFDVTEKSSKTMGDLITTYDYEIEKYLISKFNKKYPDFDIVSEEYNTDNKLSPNCFVIDPIDGTINFANNIHIWAIQVACIKNNETVAAVIYFPKLKELYCADENGAYLNNKKITINNFDLSKSIVSATGRDSITTILNTNQPYALTRNFYCAGLDFSYVASGKIGGTVFTNNTLWDYIPGMFICEKAGAFNYSENDVHISANSQELLDILKEARYKTKLS